jgi:glutamate 5-kinase
MASKLAAARIASFSGVRTCIAAAHRPGVLGAAVRDEANAGTVFEPHPSRLGARKLWIGFASAVAGRVVVDDGARRALVERNTSLLHAGVVEVHGDFDEGDTIEIVGVDGRAIARGMVAADADTARKVARLRSADLPSEVAHELVHRDDLVLLPA